MEFIPDQAAKVKSARDMLLKATRIFSGEENPLDIVPSTF
jgi:hypothetical protein